MALNIKVDYCKSNFDKKNNAFLDFSNSFDKIFYYLLLIKLKYYGFSEQALVLIRNQLTDRFYIVSLNNCESKMERLNIGVSQGRTSIIY